MPRTNDPMRGHVAGAVLAGGRSSRFGSPKGEAPIGDETLLERTVRVMTAALGVAPVVAGTPTLPDRRPGKGPLGGLETALASVAAEQVVVVACDMPGVTPALIALLADHSSAADVVLPVVDGRRQPLCARWRRDVLPRIAAALDAGRLSVHGLLDSLSVDEVPEAALRARGIDPGSALSNVNTPDDLDRFLGRRP